MTSNTVFEPSDVLQARRRNILNNIDKAEHKIDTLTREIETLIDSNKRRADDIVTLDAHIAYCKDTFDRAFVYVLEHYYASDLSLMIRTADITDQVGIVNTFTADLAYRAFTVMMQYLGTRSPNYGDLVIVYKLSMTCSTLHRSIRRFIHPPTVNGIAMPPSIIYLISAEQIRKIVDYNYDILSDESNHATYGKHSVVLKCLSECKRWLTILIRYYGDETYTADNIPSQIPHMVRGFIDRYIKDAKTEPIRYGAISEPPRNNTDVMDRFKLYSENKDVPRTGRDAIHAHNEAYINE